MASISRRYPHTLLGHSAQARRSIRRPVSQRVGQIAAIALRRRMMLPTLHARAYSRTGIEAPDPWSGTGIMGPGSTQADSHREDYPRHRGLGLPGGRLSASRAAFPPHPAPRADHRNPAGNDPRAPGEFESNSQNLGDGDLGEAREGLLADALQAREPAPCRRRRRYRRPPGVPRPTAAPRVEDRRGPRRRPKRNRRLRTRATKVDLVPPNDRRHRTPRPTALERCAPKTRKQLRRILPCFERGVDVEAARKILPWWEPAGPSRNASERVIASRDPDAFDRPRLVRSTKSSLCLEERSRG